MTSNRLRQCHLLSDCERGEEVTSGEALVVVTTGRRRLFVPATHASYRASLTGFPGSTYASGGGDFWAPSPVPLIVVTEEGSCGPGAWGVGAEISCGKTSERWLGQSR
jgi:hypothetical protein